MLQRKILLGSSATDIVATWSNPKIVKNVFGLGAAEAAAVINLAMHIPDECVKKLAKAVEKYGMVRGPVTHAAIGSDAFRVRVCHKI